MGLPKGSGALWPWAADRVGRTSFAPSVGPGGSPALRNRATPAETSQRFPQSSAHSSPGAGGTERPPSPARRMSAPSQPHNAPPSGREFGRAARETVWAAVMTAQQGACQEVGNVLARLLAGAVLLCVASNAFFLFYLQPRGRQGAANRRPDCQRQVDPNEGRQQPASSRDGSPCAQRAPPAVNCRKPSVTKGQRPAAEGPCAQRSDCCMGTSADQKGQPVIFVVPELHPSLPTAHWEGNWLGAGPARPSPEQPRSKRRPRPPAPANLEQIISGSRWAPTGGIRSRGLSLRARIAEPPPMQ